MSPEATLLEALPELAARWPGTLDGCVAYVVDLGDEPRRLGWMSPADAAAKVRAMAAAGLMVDELEAIAARLELGPGAGVPAFVLTEDGAVALGEIDPAELRRHRVGEVIGGREPPRRKAAWRVH